MSERSLSKVVVPSLGLEAEDARPRRRSAAFDGEDDALEWTSAEEGDAEEEEESGADVWDDEADRELPPGLVPGVAKGATDTLVRRSERSSTCSCATTAEQPQKAMSSSLPQCATSSQVSLSSMATTAELEEERSRTVSNLSAVVEASSGGEEPRRASSDLSVPSEFSATTRPLPILCSKATCTFGPRGNVTRRSPDVIVEDDYDPRNPEYITEVSVEEAVEREAQLLGVQIAKLRAAVESRRARARRRRGTWEGAGDEVLRSYQAPLRDMEEQWALLKRGPWAVPLEPEKRNIRDSTPRGSRNAYLCVSECDCDIEADAPEEESAPRHAERMYVRPMSALAAHRIQEYYKQQDPWRELTEDRDI